jgi:hypothetical protein
MIIQALLQVPLQELNPFGMSFHLPPCGLAKPGRLTRTCRAAH